MKIYDNITDALLRRHIIEGSDTEVCKLGLQIIISDIINILCIVMIGYLFDRLLFSLIYIVTFCGIRKFSGGFHAKTFLVCRLSMIGIFVTTLFIERIFAKVAIWASVFCVVITMITMILFSPIVHPNRCLTIYEIKANKFVAILLSAVCSVIALYLSCNKYRAGLYLSLVLFTIAILMYIGKFNNARNQIATEEFNNVNSF